MATSLGLGVLVSGTGTNLQAIIDAIERGYLPARIRVVISNRKDTYGIKRAERNGLPTKVVLPTEFESRAQFDKALLTLLTQHGVDLVVLAGFMRLLSKGFVETFQNRILNIHPSLLPCFPGLGAQRKAIESGVRISGATVHLVDEKMDHGPIISQCAVPVYSDDDERTLTKRILKQEHRIYPWSIKLFAEGRVHINNGRVIILNEPRVPDAFIQPSEYK